MSDKRKAESARPGGVVGCRRVEEEGGEDIEKMRKHDVRNREVPEETREKRRYKLSDKVEVDVGPGVAGGREKRRDGLGWLVFKFGSWEEVASKAGKSPTSKHEIVRCGLTILLER